MTRIMTAILTAVLLYLPAGAATILQDDFSNAATSAAQWVDFDNIRPTFSGGSMHAGSRIAWPAMITRAVNCNTFTYSARIRTIRSGQFPLPGIVFCGGLRQKNATTSYYGGYTFTVSTGQTFCISKMLSDGTVPMIYSAYSSFVSDVENVLTVSKAGTHLIFFCNGVFVKGVVDSTFNSGEIGVTLYNGDSIQVDDVLLTDEFRSGYEIKNFRDPFNDPLMTGWNLWVNGWTAPALATVSGGVLTFAPDPLATLTAIYTDGAYRDAPVKVRARFNTGDSSAFYGLMLMQFSRTFSTSSIGIAPAGQTGFVISAKGDWGWFSSGSWIPQKTSAVHGLGGWDTLTVQINASKGLDFYINGTNMGTYNETKFDYNAVGLYVDRGLTAQFDDFAAGDSAVGVGVINRNRPSRPLVYGPDISRANGTVWYDLAGRISRQTAFSGLLVTKAPGIIKRVLIK